MIGLLVAAVAVGACAPPETDRRLGAVWTVDADPVLRVGGHDERPGHQLDRVLDAVRLSTGGLAVATRGGTDIRLFDEQGRLVATAGGEGAGPAEFQRLQSVSRRGDTIVVYTGDPAIAWVSPGGEVVRKELLRSVHPFPACRTGIGRRVLLPDGRLLLAHGPASSPGCPSGSESEDGDVVAFLWDPRTGIVDSLGAFPSHDESETGWAPFGNITLIGGTAGRLYIGSSRSDTVAVFDYDGNRTGVLRLDIEARRTSPALRSKVHPGEPPVPDEYPLIGHLIGDEAGNIWVLEYPALDVPLPSEALTSGAVFVDAPKSFEWVVLDAAGEVVGRARTPSHWQILEIGAAEIVVLEHDSLEVETVGVYRLNKSGGDAGEMDAGK